MPEFNPALDKTVKMLFCVLPKAPVKLEVWKWEQLLQIYIHTSQKVNRVNKKTLYGVNKVVCFYFLSHGLLFDLLILYTVVLYAWHP